MDITITLTDAEVKALAYVTVDVQDWVDNAIKERCRLAMEEIFKLEVERMAADPSVKTIPADKEEVVLAADIKSAADRHQEYLDSLVTNDKS
jgi:hypothetical protein